MGNAALPLGTVNKIANETMAAFPPPDWLPIQPGRAGLLLPDKLKQILSQIHKGGKGK